MAKNIFNKGHYSEADALDEQNGDFEIEEPIRRERSQPSQQQREELHPRRDSEEMPFKLNKDDRDAVRNVTLRLEQARIYEALIKSDLFDGFEADPKAIDNVKTELKDFLVDRLKILMGIGQERKKNQSDLESVTFDLPFNELEIEFLKALALQGTKGQSASSNVATVTAKTQQSSEKQRNGIKGLGKSERNKINPIKRVNEVKVKYVEPEYEEDYEEEEEENFPPPRQEKTRQERIPLPKRKSEKKYVDMTDQEILERNEEINREQRLKKSRTPENATPMPSAQMQESMVRTRANAGGGDQGMAAILNVVLANKNK